MRQFMAHEFNKFFVVGILNTGFYYSVYVVGLHVVILPYIIAHIVAVFMSMIGSFFLNCYITFGVKPTWRKFFNFPLTQLVNIGATLVMLFILVECFRINSSLAPIAALVVTVPITFVVTGKVMKAA